jgi:hypothetical protein
VVIEESITIAALHKHLTTATSETPEIGITIFGNGAQVLEVGTTEHVLSALGWKTFQQRGNIIFHTHPDPTDAERMRQPSDGDITDSILLGQPFTIGSRDGLTLGPKPEFDLSEHTGLTLWHDYVISRGFNKDGFSAYGPRRVYTEFIRDIIKPRFIEWSMLSAEDSLANVILSQRDH